MAHLRRLVSLLPVSVSGWSSTHWCSALGEALKLLCCLMLCQGIGWRAAADTGLPVAVAARVKRFETQSPIAISRRGDWIAAVYQEQPTRVSAAISKHYSDSGVPFTQGEGRRHILLVRVTKGRTVDLSADEGSGSSWGASWSPDGAQLAYYADTHGSAGLWIYDLASGGRRRIGDFVVRPFFATDLPQWIDARTLLVKALPSGETLASANAADPRASDLLTNDCPRSSIQTCVRVLRSPEADARIIPPIMEAARADLLQVDTMSGRASVLIARELIGDYAVSPDGRQVAFTRFTTSSLGSQFNFDLHLFDRGSREDRPITPGSLLSYGYGFSWSSDGSKIAFLARSDTGGRTLRIAGVDGRSMTFDHPCRAQDSAGDGPAQQVDSNAPLWEEDGSAVWAIAGGKLCRFDGTLGTVTATASASGMELLRLLRSADGKLIALARTPGSQAMSLEAVDAEGGRRTLRRFENIYLEPGNVAASYAGGVAFLAEDSGHMADLWWFDLRTMKIHKLMCLNPELDSYPHGAVRVVHWKSLSGNPRNGLLLVPPRYRTGTRLPVVVFVYGGTTVQNGLNRYGFGWGDSPALNLQVLATAGYGVFYPDLPVRAGSEIGDIMDSLSPGVDAIISAGWADPERLAIMGQSYGAYTSWSVITRTSRFKAAITSANVMHPDLFAAYLYMGPEGSGSNIGYFEQGQGNMGGSIWEVPGRYRENSPLFTLDRVHTPLLMGQGSDDGNLEASNALFVALRRLGIETEYRVYPGEGHVIGMQANVRDWWERRLSFLQQHLQKPGNR